MIERLPDVQPHGAHMKVKPSSVRIDTSLEPFLVADTDKEADKLISQLISVHAEPVIKLSHDPRGAYPG
jgi:hypothetical protein